MRAASEIVAGRVVSIVPSIRNRKLTEEAAWLKLGNRRDGPQGSIAAMLNYHPLVGRPLPIDASLLRPGLRLAVGLSGGADSVALLRSLAEQGRELGLVLHAAHLHHGLRGAEADDDLAFAKSLAGQLGIPFHESRVDTVGEAQPKGEIGKSSETIEEAARRLRYGWFRQLMASGVVDCVATGHTLDDQAETVLAKFLRGAWTEGLSGIHPVVEFPEGRILRPILGVTRAEVEAYLRGIGQGWREDSSNRQLSFTRNRIRHELLPLLETWNPRLREHLAQMAELAREEESWWSGEVSRASAGVMLRGRPVRGGGRASSEGVGVDIARLGELPVAVQRRVLRRAAEELGIAIDFHATESMRSLALAGRAGQKSEAEGGLRAERTHRELRLSIQPREDSTVAESLSEVTIPIPGEVSAFAFGVHIRIRLAGTPGGPSSAVLRAWRAGDRVSLRHSSGPRKVKEVLERLRVTGTERASWPVLQYGGRIVWMRGVAVEPEPSIEVTATALASLGGEDS